MAKNIDSMYTFEEIEELTSHYSLMDLVKIRYECRREVSEYLVKFSGDDGAYDDAWYAAEGYEVELDIVITFTKKMRSPDTKIILDGNTMDMLIISKVTYLSDKIGKIIINPFNEEPSLKTQIVLNIEKEGFRCYWDSIPTPCKILESDVWNIEGTLGSQTPSLVLTKDGYYVSYLIFPSYGESTLEDSQEIFVEINNNFLYQSLF